MKEKGDPGKIKFGYSVPYTVGYTVPSPEVQCTIAILLAIQCLIGIGVAQDVIKFSHLSPLPDQHGLAGPFAGIINGELLVTGGANFPENPPWQGGRKAWHDQLYVFDLEKGEWRGDASSSLPEARAYGVSLSLPERNSAVFIGGSDSSNQPTKTVWEVTRAGGKTQFAPLPDLPVPLAEMTGVSHRNFIYIFSGRTKTGVAQKAWRLDINDSGASWEEVSWPQKARGRMHAVSGVLGNAIYLAGGRDFMSPDPIAHPGDRLAAEKLDFLRDTWRFEPSENRWTRLSDLPRGMSAAPSSLIASGKSHLIMIGSVSAGFVKEQMAARPEVNGQGNDHPGFSKTVWRYDVKKDEWSKAGEMPHDMIAPVTAPVVPVGPQSFIIPSGEIKPGVRTRQVVKGSF